MSKAYSKTSKAFAAALFAAALALSATHARAQAQKRPAPEKRTPAASAASVVSTRAQYLARVREVAETLESFAAFCEQMSRAEKPEVWSKDGSALDIAQEFPERQESALERTRTLLPPKERVESAGGPVEVDNTWLHSALSEYSKLSDNNKRAVALRSAAQRLRALEERLAEAEASPAQDKDAERGRLNAILRDPEFNKPPKGNALQQLMEGIRDWLARRAPRLGGGAAPSRNLSQIAQVVVIGLCVLVLAYVARRVWSGRARELKSLKLKRRRPRVILGERLEPDAEPADLLSAAEALARAGDLRGAVRKAYVALLCGLGDGGVIRLAQHKTNRDYLEAVRRSASQRLYSEMLPLTRGFEQHWYGLRDTTAAEWDDFSARCHHMLRRV